MPPIPSAWISTTACTHWIPPPSISAYRCFPGRSFAATKARGRCTRCSTCMAISPRLSALPTATCTTPTSSTRFHRRQGRSTEWIKQHLGIKAFYGTSENAVKTQIWVAVSVYVLVAIVRKRLALDASLYQILQILSVTLFEKTPILQALQASDSQEELAGPGNQLILFDF